jgi:hypothetical protein
MTKIEDFRKKEFRNTIKTIAEQRGADFKYRDMKWFLGKDGVTKSVRMNNTGKVIEDVIAGFWLNNGSVEVITFGDYQAFLRDTKLAEVFGEEVPVVKDFQKKIERQLKDIKVGSIYACTDGGRCSYTTNLFMVVKRTKTKAWVVPVNYEVPMQYMKNKLEAVGPEYEVRCAFTELVVENISIEDAAARDSFVIWGKSWYKMNDITEGGYYLDAYWFD